MIGRGELGFMMASESLESGLVGDVAFSATVSAPGGGGEGGTPEGGVGGVGPCGRFERALGGNGRSSADAHMGLGCWLNTRHRFVGRGLLGGVVGPARGPQKRTEGAPDPPPRPPRGRAGAPARSRGGGAVSSVLPPPS